MDGHYKEAGNPSLPTENGMDGKADLMIKLLEKLPQIVTKPIVVQHTQTMDERFTLTVNEAEEGVEKKPNTNTRN